MTIAALIAIFLIIALIILIIVTGYVKAPPDKAFIISGWKKEPKILIGRAGIKFPFLERKDTLVLKQISIDIKTNGYVPTLDFIGVDIDAGHQKRRAHHQCKHDDNHPDTFPRQKPGKSRHLHKVK